MFEPTDANLDRLMKGFTLLFFWIYGPLMLLGWIVEKVEERVR